MGGTGQGEGKGRGCGGTGGARKVVCPGARAGSRRAWRDASCLSVVSFNSTKRRVESFIVSYRFVTACS